MMYFNGRKIGNERIRASDLVMLPYASGENFNIAIQSSDTFCELNINYNFTRFG